MTRIFLAIILLTVIIGIVTLASAFISISTISNYSTEIFIAIIAFFISSTLLLMNFEKEVGDFIASLLDMDDS